MISLEHFDCVADIFRYQSKKNGSNVAQIFEGRTTTYSELDNYANQVANGLLNSNCVSGTRIGFLGKNSDY